MQGTPLQNGAPPIQQSMAMQQQQRLAPPPMGFRYGARPMAIPVCYNCGVPGHYKSNCPLPYRQGNGEPICTTCGQTGHMQNTCPIQPMLMQIPMQI